MAQDSFKLVSFQASERPHDLDAVRLALESVLARKGRVVDALADTTRALRRFADARELGQFQRLQTIRSSLAAEATRRTESEYASTDWPKVNELLAESEAIEKELAEIAAGESAELESDLLETIISRIPPARPWWKLFDIPRSIPRRPRKQRSPETHATRPMCSARIGHPNGSISARRMKSTLLCESSSNHFPFRRRRIARREPSAFTAM